MIDWKKFDEDLHFEVSCLGLDPEHPEVRKVIGYSSREDGGFMIEIIDKQASWHSPEVRDTREPAAVSKPNKYRIRITTTEQVGRMLETLAAQGIYGRNVCDVAERLMCRELERLVTKPKVKSRRAALTSLATGAGPEGNGNG